MSLPDIENHQLYPDVPTFVDGMYSIYSADFLHRQLSFGSGNILLRNSPSGSLFGKDYDWSFHHIVTREQNDKSRNLDIPRAERIRFPGYYIEQASSLLVWNRRKDNEDKYYISDPEFRYLTVLGRRSSGHFMLITAFPTNGKYYREKLKKEYETITGIVL